MAIQTASYRYRLFHHKEQTSISNTSFGIKTFHHLAYGEGGGLIYLHRLPLTSRSLPLVLTAKLRRIPVVFDTDDLVWDQNERLYNHLDDHYSPEVVRQILKTTRRMHAMMRLADAFVVSTEYLAERVREAFRQPVFVNQNALSQEQVALSDAAYSARAKDRNDLVVISYFSGQAKVHDEDVAGIAPALCATLERFPQARFRIYGGLELRAGLEQERFHSQIERHDAVDWRELPKHIAQTDITIAPLIDNPQRRAKSAVKYLEAAAVGVPIVAARLEPYALINHSTTGLLAWTNDEWQGSLAKLIEHPQLRAQIGDAARRDVLAHHTTTARAPNFERILKQIVQR